MEDYSTNTKSRKRENSSSDEDHEDENVEGLTEKVPSVKRQKIKEEADNIEINREPGNTDISSSEQSKTLKSEPPVIKEEPSEDRHSDTSANRIRHSLDSDSDDDFTNIDR